MQIEWLPLQAALFYAATWFVAFAVALVSTLASERIKSIRTSFFSSCLLGLIALGWVIIRTGNDPDNIAGHLSYIGYSIFFGLAGPWQKKIIEGSVKLIAKSYGIEIEDDSNREKD